MAQYKTGTVTVSAGSAVVTGMDTVWLINAQAGNSFVVKGIARVYDIASVDSDTQVTLTAPWQGADLAAVQYAIQRDFTSDGIPEMAQGDIETAAIFTRAMRKIQALLGQVAGVAGTGAGIFQTTAAGLAATTDGQYFWVPDVSGLWESELVLYQNQAAAAANIGRYPSSATLESFMGVIAAEQDARRAADDQIIALINSLHPELAEQNMVLDFEHNSFTIGG